MKEAMIIRDVLRTSSQQYKKKQNRPISTTVSEIKIKKTKRLTVKTHHITKVGICALYILYLDFYYCLLKRPCHISNLQEDYKCILCVLFISVQTSKA